MIKKCFAPLLVFFASNVLVLGCVKESAKPTDEAAPVEAPITDSTGDAEEEAGLRVYPLAAPLEFPEARLALDGLANGADLSSREEIEFSFEVTNFVLGEPTEDAETRSLANSAEGQHIHFILNNEPYTAFYDSSFGTGFDKGDYLMLAFLSRSYHESLKNREAYVVRHFTIDGASRSEIDLEAPHLFYSRPMGTYTGSDTEKLLLDFYLINTTLSADGHQVRATIDGTEHMLTKWRPYVIEGLRYGEIEITLELVDDQGNLIPGPFNRVTRTVTLTSEDENAA